MYKDTDGAGGKEGAMERGGGDGGGGEGQGVNEVPIHGLEYLICSPTDELA